MPTDQNLDERVARLEAGLENLRHIVDLLEKVDERAQQKFEENVAARFVQVNEFRGALDDLSRGMATRRETEALTVALTELRSRIDVGPVELRTLSRAIEDIRAEHVNRRELDEVKSRLDEGTGRRTAFIASLSVITAIFAIMFGVILKGGITRQDVSAQIQTEAPWLSDRPGVENRITVLERENEQLKVRLAQAEALNKFFCRTRQPLLPGC